MDPRECSFCLTPRLDADYLVATERVSICDECVRRARPRGVYQRLWRWLRGGQSPAAAGPLPPYRDGVGITCSFCGAAPGVAVRGAKACICATCLALADEVLIEGMAR